MRFEIALWRPTATMFATLKLLRQPYQPKMFVQSRRRASGGLVQTAGPLAAAQLIGQRTREIALAHLFAPVDDAALDRTETNALKLRIGIIRKGIEVRTRMKRQLGVAEFELQIVACSGAIRSVEPDDLAKASSHRRIKRAIKVCRGNKKALGANAVDDEQQAVDDAAKLVMVARVVPSTGKRAEFVEKQDAVSTADQFRARGAE